MNHRIALALVPCLLAGLAAAAADAPGPSPDTLEVYKAKCQSCHMADGNSPLEPLNFIDDKWKNGSTLDDVEKVIAEGVPGSAMLPFKGQVTPAQVKALAAYVRSFDKTLKPAPRAKKPAVKKSAPTKSS